MDLKEYIYLYIPYPVDILQPEHELSGKKQSLVGEFRFLA